MVGTSVLENHSLEVKTVSCCNQAISLIDLFFLRIVFRNERKRLLRPSLLLRTRTTTQSSASRWRRADVPGENLIAACSERSRPQPQDVVRRRSGLEHVLSFPSLL